MPGDDQTREAEMEAQSRPSERSDETQLAWRPDLDAWRVVLQHRRSRSVAPCSAVAGIRGFRVPKGGKVLAITPKRADHLFVLVIDGE